MSQELTLPADDQFSVKVYVYCPPCACQVATAFDICFYLNKSRYLDACLRVNEHQPTCSSSSSSRIEGLASLVDHAKVEESTANGDSGYINQKLSAFDRQWHEQIIDDYEEEVQITPLSPSDQLARIVRSHERENLCAAIIVLGEADYSVPLISSPPFPPFKPGRSPEETRLYRFYQTHSFALSWHWRRQYMGTYTRKAQVKKRPLSTTQSNGADDPSSEPLPKRSVV